MTRSHNILGHGMNRTAVQFAQDRTREDGETRYVYRDRRGEEGPSGRRWYVQAPHGVAQDQRPAGVECIARVYRSGSNVYVREIDPETEREVVFE